MKVIGSRSVVSVNPSVRSVRSPSLGLEPSFSGIQNVSLVSGSVT